MVARDWRNWRMEWAVFKVQWLGKCFRPGCWKSLPWFTNHVECMHCQITRFCKEVEVKSDQETDCAK